MSGIQRFNCASVHGTAAMLLREDGVWIQSSDYDAAQSELAAIRRRESLLKEKLDDCEKSESALREELDALKHPMNSAQILRKELKAAEQRNAELEALIIEAHAWVDQNNFGGWDAYALRDRLAAVMEPSK